MFCPNLTIIFKSFVFSVSIFGVKDDSFCFKVCTIMVEDPPPTKKMNWPTRATVTCHSRLSCPLFLWDLMQRRREMMAVSKSDKKTGGRVWIITLSEAQQGAWNVVQPTLNPSLISNWSISKAGGQEYTNSFDHGDHTSVKMALPECFCSGCVWCGIKSN